MRQYLAAALIAASPAVADTPFLTGDALAAEVRKDCADGCVVMNRTQADAFVESVNGMLKEREDRAFEAGKKQGNLSCRNAV